MRWLYAAVSPTAHCVRVAGIAVLLFVSACASGQGEAPESGSEPQEREDGEQGDSGARPEDPESQETNLWTLPEARADISLHRVDDDHMVAQMSLVNEGDASLPANMEPLYTLLNDEYQQAAGEVLTGVAWLDPGGRVLHKPFVDDEGSCLCSDTGDASTLGSAGSERDTWEGYAVLQAPPEDVEELTVVTRVAPPFVDVPVQEGAPDGLDYAAPADAPQAEPQPAELESVVTSEEETVIEDSEATNINLSTDVLFDVEESELTGEADALIEDVAGQIEDAEAAEVTVEGHADSTGDDAINDPLSQDRADAVRDGLEESVDADVDYTTEGYGADDPIASNDSEEGRALNRRVTISVPKDASVDQRVTGEEPERSEGTAPEDVSFTGPAGDPDNPELQADVALTDLRAVTDSTALLTYQVTNPEDENIGVGLDMGQSWMDFRVHSAHAVSLVDGDATAHPLRVESLDGDDFSPSCLCTSASGSDLSALIIRPERTHNYYAFLPITPGSTTVDISFADIGDARDVRIQR
ncbi:OmpA family protein [Spiractinospora alimapuensis]|uniref:OmpA family protein n=1 Tax=Spiractinospora alimapuensis TaxID=2820884 RepID=UPI001F23A7FC|nr:OmpA family protein [Spiractinospora alimapuensis]QVQ53985.1 OmpA family protein [Spiractinospora alimapuensis]